MKAWKRSLLAPVLLACFAWSAPASGAVISGGISTTDTGLPSAFGFLISTPITALFGMASYTATVSGTLTDAAGDGVSATLAPAQSSIFGFSANNGTEFLGDSLTYPVSASFGPAIYTGTYDCGVVGCSSLQARISFTGSGGGDMYSFQTRLELVEQRVPEPGTLALLGLGLIGLVAARRGKR